MGRICIAAWIFRTHVQLGAYMTTSWLYMSRSGISSGLCVYSCRSHYRPCIDWWYVNKFASRHGGKEKKKNISRIFHIVQLSVAAVVELEGHEPLPTMDEGLRPIVSYLEAHACLPHSSLAPSQGPFQLVVCLGATPTQWWQGRQGFWWNALGHLQTSASTFDNYNWQSINQRVIWVDPCDPLPPWEATTWRATSSHFAAWCDARFQPQKVSCILAFGLAWIPIFQTSTTSTYMW